MMWARQGQPGERIMWARQGQPGDDVGQAGSAGRGNTITLRVTGSQHQRETESDRRTALSRDHTGHADFIDPIKTTDVWLAR